MMNGKKYFPNNIDAINEAPSNFFPPVDVEEFFQWKVGGWEIPSSVCCIIRAEHRKTGKITEHVYSKPKYARNRLLKYIESDQHDVTICNHEQISLLTNEPFDSNDD